VFSDISLTDWCLVTHCACDKLDFNDDKQDYKSDLTTNQTRFLRN